MRERICSFCGERARSADSPYCVECAWEMDAIPDGYYLRETADGAELVRKHEREPMQSIDEPVEEDDTTGDVLLVRASEELPTRTWDAVACVQRQGRARGTASGIQYWTGERSVEALRPRSAPDESPIHETAESISDRVQRQVSEALLSLDAIAEEIKAVGLSLVEVGRYLSDDDHDDMLHQATELATVRQEVRRVQNQVFQRKQQMNVRTEKVS